MKIVLINPPAEQIVDPWDTPPFPHLGLASLSAFCQYKGIRVLPIDGKFERLTEQDIISRVRDFVPDIIGITAMTNYITAGARIAEKLKKIFPQAVFVVGGAHPTALPKETLDEFPVFNIAVIGEGEEILWEIAQKKISEWNEIPGITYRNENKIIVQTGFRRRIENLDMLPFPAWSLFPPAKIYPIITSRGCPFRCVFCMRMQGNAMRLRSAQNVVDEIAFLFEKYTVTHIPVLDELFTINRKRVDDVCDLLIQRNLHKKITWGANARVTGVNYEMFKKMHDAGCRKIDFGIESGNEEILKLIKKDITIKEAFAAVSAAKKAHLQTHGLFILGHPNETLQTVKDTIALAVTLNTTYLSMGIMVPYPGTEVYEMAKAGLYGYKIISKNWNDYNKQIGNALELKTIDRKILEKMQAIAYIKFYLCNFRIFGFMRFIFSYRRSVWFYVRKKLFRWCN